MGKDKDFKELHPLTKQTLLIIKTYYPTNINKNLEIPKSILLLQGRTHLIR